MTVIPSSSGLISPVTVWILNLGPLVQIVRVLLKDWRRILFLGLSSSPIRRVAAALRGLVQQSGQNTVTVHGDVLRVDPTPGRGRLA